MAFVFPNNMWGLQRTGQLCSKILNDKITKALQYAANSSIYDAELTLLELTTSQSLLLSLLYGLLHQDITFCLNMIEASSAAVQLKSSYMKVWLQDDFMFKHEDVAKAFSNLAELMHCTFQSQFKLPQSIAVAFSGLVDKYKLFELFNLTGDKKALELVKALSSYVLGLTKEIEVVVENGSAAVGSEVVTHDVESSTKKNESNENGSAAVGSEVTHDVESSTKKNESNENLSAATGSVALTHDAELNTNNNQSNDNGSAAVGFEVVAHDVESSTKKNESNEIQRLVTKAEEATPSLFQTEDGIGSSNNSTLRRRRIEVSSVIQSEDGSGPSKHCTLRRRRIEVSPFIQSEDGSGPSKHCSLRRRRIEVSPFIQSKVGNEASTSSIMGSALSLSVDEDRIYRCLKNAVRHNKLRDIRDLMKPGIDANWKTESGDGLLHIAVYYGCEEAVVELLQCGALPEMKNRDFISPLQLAVRLNIPSIFQALLEYVSDINQVFKGGNTILHEIASEGTSSYIESVLKYKPNVELKNDDGYTALHMATKSGHITAVKALITAGADVNTLSNRGESCLHITVGNGNACVLKCLLPRANIRYKNPITKFSVLHTAAYKGDIACIEALLQQGLNVNNRIFSNRTALHEAAEQGHLAAVRVLLALGAAVNAIAKNKCMPLHCAAANGFHEIVIALLDGGALINAKDKDGNTPLRLAKYHRRYLVEVNLIFRGAKE